MPHTWAEYGIETRGKTSGEVKATCPQCSHTRKKASYPCLNVNLDKEVWHCWHCEWSGSLHSGEDRPSTRYATPRVYRKPVYRSTPLPQRVLAWFASRGIPETVLARNRISYGQVYMPQIESDVTAIQFPYFRDGEVVNVKYRDGQKHFRMVGGGERLLYGCDDVAPPSVVIVEGEMDKLALEVAGITSCVSVPDGAPSPQTKNYASKFEYLATAEALLQPCSKIVLAVDNDAPGEVLAQELARRLGPERCWRVEWAAGCKDANDVLVSYGATTLRECIEQATPWPISGIVSVGQLKSGIMEMYEHGIQRGLSPGWSTLARYYTVRAGEMTVVTGIPGDGKALALDTPLPTPQGWTTMGDVGVGDGLFDERGMPCRVTAVSAVMHGHDCYQVMFADGTVVVCDAEHEWRTRDDRARRSLLMARKNNRLEPRALCTRGTDQSTKRSFPSVVTTATLASTLLTPDHGRHNHAVAVAASVQLPECPLPIAPYVLGAWLGDGTAACGSLTCFDNEILKEIEREGYRVTAQPATPGRYTIRGLQPLLRGAGVLARKHIPQAYLRASHSQRLALLQGLMDTDGSVTPRGKCEFSNTNRMLAEQVYDLIVGLGMKTGFVVAPATLYRRVVGERYRLIFTPHEGVFRLGRKAQYLQYDTVSPQAQWRMIVKCIRVPSVPVKCVQVDSPSRLYLATRAYVPTHNSTFLSALAVNLAREASWRFAIFSPENVPLERYAVLLIEQWSGHQFDGVGGRMPADLLSWGMEWLEEHITFLLPEDAVPTIPYLLDLARVQVLRQGIRGLILDPWSEIEHSRPAGQTETEYVSHMLTLIRRFARLHGVHVWVVAHPSKLLKSKDGRYDPPTPYQISGSAHFYNKADNCVTVWRDRTADHHRVEIHVSKIRSREIGRTGMVELAYDPLCRRYADLPEKEVYSSWHA